MTRLRLYQTACPVHTLGPFVRYGIWVQGCQKRCPGCISPQAQSMDGGYEVEVETLSEYILSESGIEGLTISGGEPFLQSAALCELIHGIRRRRDLGVIVYTGYAFAEIAADPLTALCDAVIDGAYVEHLDDGRSLRGSSNQHLICLTGRYLDSMPFGRFRRRTELLRTKEGGLSLVGIPEEQDERLADRLREFWKEGNQT